MWKKRRKKPKRQRKDCKGRIRRPKVFHLEIAIRCLRNKNAEDIDFLICKQVADWLQYTAESMVEQAKARTDKKLLKMTQEEKEPEKFDPNEIPPF